MDFDELGVVGKLALSAIERRQNHHQPSNINAFLVIFVPKNHQHASILTFFDRKKSSENDQKSKYGHEMH